VVAGKECFLRSYAQKSAKAGKKSWSEPLLKKPPGNTACTTDKVTLIPPTEHLSTNGSRIRSGLIAIKIVDLCLKMTEYRANIEE
jgi:hypothetical protein